MIHKSHLYLIKLHLYGCGFFVNNTYKSLLRVASFVGQYFQGSYYFVKEYKIFRETARVLSLNFLPASINNRFKPLEDTRFVRETKVANVLLIRKFLCVAFAMGQIYAV